MSEETLFHEALAKAPEERAAFLPAVREVKSVEPTPLKQS